MSNIVLKFANDVQYQQFVDKVKAELLEELKQEGVVEERRYYWWQSYKKNLRSKLHGRYKSGNRLPSYTFFYDCYKCIFGVPERTHIDNAMNLESAELTEKFTNELIALIDKYKEEAQKEGGRG